MVQSLLVRSTVDWTLPTTVDIVGAVMVHGTNTLADTVRNLPGNKEVAHHKLGLWR